MAKADKTARFSRSKRSGRSLGSKAMTATGRSPKLSRSLDGLVFTAALRVAQAALFAAKVRNRSKRG